MDEGIEVSVWLKLFVKERMAGVVIDRPFILADILNFSSFIDDLLLTEWSCIFFRNIANVDGKIRLVSTRRIDTYI